MKPLWIGAALALGACGPPSSLPVAEVLQHAERYYGKEITVRARFRPGVSCRLSSNMWQTYCGDCQYCEGPLVADVPQADLPKGADARPLVLRGRWKKQDIRCEGPLNHVRCHPATPGPYVIRGVLENRHPPRLLVNFIWPVEE